MEKSNKGKTDEIIRNKGIWKRFFHTCVAAHVPFILLGVYILLTVAEGQILIRIPQINGNFFAGDVSPSSIGMFLGFEILNMFVCQFVLYVNHILRYRMDRNLRNSLWGKILKLKPAYFDKVSPSSLISRITVDTDAFNEFVLDVVLELATQAYYLVLTIYAMSTISIKAGIILLAFLPITIIFTFIMGRLQLKTSGKMKQRLSDLTAYLSELITCLPLLKSLNRQEYETKRGEKVIRDYYKSQRNFIGLDVLKQCVGAVVGIGPEIVIILMGVSLLKDGTFDAAGWYTFYLYAGTFIVFCNTLGSMWERTKGVQGQLIKVSDILYEEAESLDSYVQEIVDSGDIIFDHVKFAYDEDVIFEDASFTVPKNATTVLIGYSGSGKSTILKLIERIYEPLEGRILMGGQNISAYGIKQWRNNIAYLSQSTPLLSGTIRDNICYGIQREVTEEEIMDAVRKVNLDEFINQHPEGLEREVGQFGDKLSGGQKQKISIVRALLSGAEILILDEPTASLDILSTNEIMQTITSLRGEKTIILVTHDTRVMQSVDHFIVVNKDHSIQSGNEKDMRLMSDFYNQLMGEER